MDKFFLLIYTWIGYDGLRHSCHSWFGTEQEMREFSESSEAKQKEIEVELAIEILSHREILL